MDFVSQDNVILEPSTNAGNVLKLLEVNVTVSMAASQCAATLSAVVVLLHARPDGQDVGVEDDILRREVDGHQHVVRGNLDGGSRSSRGARCPISGLSQRCGANAMSLAALLAIKQGNCAESE